jgi:hypothetical protein
MKMLIGVLISIFVFGCFDWEKERWESMARLQAARTAYVKDRGIDPNSRIGECILTGNCMVQGMSPYEVRLVLLDGIPERFNNPTDEYGLVGIWNCRDCGFSYDCQRTGSFCLRSRSSGGYATYEIETWEGSGWGRAKWTLYFTNDKLSDWHEYHPDDVRY